MHVRPEFLAAMRPALSERPARVLVQGSALFLRAAYRVAAPLAMRPAQEQARAQWLLVARSVVMRLRRVVWLEPVAQWRRVAQSAAVRPRPAASQERVPVEYSLPRRKSVEPLRPLVPLGRMWRSS